MELPSLLLKLEVTTGIPAPTVPQWRYQHILEALRDQPSSKVGSLVVVGDCKGNWVKILAEIAETAGCSEGAEGSSIVGSLLQDEVAGLLQADELNAKRFQDRDIGVPDVAPTLLARIARASMTRCGSSQFKTQRGFVQP